MTVNFESKRTVALESDASVTMCIIMEGMLDGINISVTVEPITADTGNQKFCNVSIYLLVNFNSKAGSNFFFDYQLL